MEVDSSNGNNSRANEKHLIAVPVVGNSSGFGLPYAPEDWPSPGDKWRWKVGKRKTTDGHWQDRYLYAPNSCPRPENRARGLIFPSKVSIKQYIKKEFPLMDIETFFSSFIWKVPCARHTPSEGIEGNTHANTNPRCLNVIGDEVSKSASVSSNCRAGNKTCNVQSKTRANLSVAKDCDVCCSEIGFCRDCCCILCSQPVDWESEGYNIVSCEATLDENYICGHVAHLDCALRSYMAGTVGGTISLDAEYYCRRCDNRTDLMPHASKISKLCESLESQDEAEKVLSLSLRILHSSQQERAKGLRSRIELVLDKFKDGVQNGEACQLANTTITSGDTSPTRNDTMPSGTEGIKGEETCIDCIDEVEPFQKIESSNRRGLSRLYISSDHNKASIKLETEIDQVLRELKRSQKLEYRIAEEKLYTEKDFLLNLYRQLECERSELADPTCLPSGGDCNAHLSRVMNRVDQIRQEEENMSKMMTISKGFGSTPKNIVEEYFRQATDV